MTTFSLSLSLSLSHTHTHTHTHTHSSEGGMALSDSEVETLRDNTKSLKTQGAITHALSTAEEGRLPQKQGIYTHYGNVNIIKQTFPDILYLMR